MPKNFFRGVWGVIHPPIIYPPGGGPPPDRQKTRSARYSVTSQLSVPEGKYLPPDRVRGGPDTINRELAHICIN